MDATKLITLQIDPCILAATAGMLLVHAFHKDIADHFSIQVVHQLAIQGIDPDTIMKSGPNDLPIVTFQLPVFVLNEVSDTLVALYKTKQHEAAIWLMKSWTPALSQVIEQQVGLPFNGDNGRDEWMGRCMN